jgi:hypothetical protein
VGRVTHFSQYSNEDQRLYVQTVFDFFRDYARWPTFRQVEQILRKINRRQKIDDITKELPDGYANSFALHHNLDDEAILSLKAIQESDTPLRINPKRSVKIQKKS